MEILDIFRDIPCDDERETMRLPKLDKRLALIYEMLGDAKSVCDVGADHGKLALLLQKRGAKVIATDISEPSLAKTRRLIKLHNADIDCRVGDGLQVVKAGEASAIVIAGMGQNTIINIIKAGRKVIDACDFIIIQSMNREYDLRSFLSDQGFAIIDEQLVIEKRRLYCIIKARPQCSEKLSELQKYLGPRILDNKGKYYTEYIKHNKMILTDIAQGLKSAGDTDSERFKAIKSVLCEMEELDEG